MAIPYEEEANEIINLVFDNMNSETRTRVVAEYIGRIARRKEFCPATIWPYTENNLCVLNRSHEGDHEDAKGRKFTHGGYLKQ